MPPKKLSKKSAEQFRYGLGLSSLGMVLVATSEAGIVAVLIGKDAEQLVEQLQLRFPKAAAREHPSCDKLVARVIDFIEAPTGSFGLPLDIRGTAFQRRVWNAVRKIPAGKTSTYSEIARKVGAPRAMRAVGNSCSTNDLAIVIPCHRVLRKDSSPTGRYHLASHHQLALLEREAGAVGPKASRTARAGARPG